MPEISRDPFIVEESLDKDRKKENVIRVGDRIEAASSKELYRTITRSVTFVMTKI